MTDTPIENFMTLSARDLRLANPTTNALRLEIKKHIGYIQADIRAKHVTKIRHTTYDLPVNFTIPNMRNAESQTHIYASIIEQLKFNKYDVRLEMGKKPREMARLHISWISDQDIEEADRQRRIIREALEASINVDMPTNRAIS